MFVVNAQHKQPDALLDGQRECQVLKETELSIPDPEVQNLKGSEI